MSNVRRRSTRTVNRNRSRFITSRPTDGMLTLGILARRGSEIFDAPGISPTAEGCAGPNCWLSVNTNSDEGTCFAYGQPIRNLLRRWFQVTSRCVEVANSKVTELLARYQRGPEPDVEVVQLTRFDRRPPASF